MVTGKNRKVKDLLQLQKIQTLTQEHEKANLKAMITGEEAGSGCGLHANSTTGWAVFWPPRGSGWRRLRIGSWRKPRNHPWPCWMKPVRKFAGFRRN